MYKRHELHVIGAIITILLLGLLCIYFGAILGRINSIVVVFPVPSEEPIVLANVCNPNNIDDFKLIIESIGSGLEFFSSELGADSGAGTRALQAQLQIILRNFAVPAKIRVQLEQLLRNVTVVGDRIVAHILEENQSPDAKENLKQTLDWIESGSLWEFPAAGDWQDINAFDLQRFNVPDNNYIVYSGTNFSDSCIAAVLDGCNVPDECFSLFLRRRYSEYLITHTLLFLMAAKKRNCYGDKEYMEKLTKIGDPDDIMASLCAKTYREVQGIDKSGFDYEKRDLFCEQVYVCSMAGFKQFLHPLWLRTILSWQRKGSLGCFTLPINVAEMWEETYGERDEREVERYERYANVMETDIQKCHAHFTAVAISYISVYLRYLVEFCSEILFDAVGMNSG